MPVILALKRLKQKDHQLEARRDPKENKKKKFF
jgi:hypothetical protein